MPSTGQQEERPGLIPGLLPTDSGLFILYHATHRYSEIVRRHRPENLKNLLLLLLFCEKLLEGLAFDTGLKMAMIFFLFSYFNRSL